jgi:hypothetical protein
MNRRFDLLIVGHSLEYSEREQVCAAFRTYNAGAPIVQLVVAMREMNDGADHAFVVDGGPQALLNLITMILGERKTETEAAD